MSVFSHSENASVSLSQQRYASDPKTLSVNGSNNTSFQLRSRVPKMPFLVGAKRNSTELYKFTPGILPTVAICECRSRQLQSSFGLRHQDHLMS